MKIISSFSIGITLLAGLIFVSQAQAWTDQGSGSITGGQVTGIDNGSVAGAINRILVDPTSSGNRAYVGSVNGGVWVTENLLAASPHWQPLTDSLSSLSVGALAFDTADTSYQTLYYAAGSFSSLGVSGSLNGVFKSTDRGAHWTNLGAATLGNQSISSMSVHGTTILLGVNAFTGNTAAGAVYRSTDSGGNFTQLSSVKPGLPLGGVTDLVADPNKAGRFYAAVLTQGIYSTDDSGETWKALPIASSSINASTNNNIKLSIANYSGSSVLYAGVINTGQASGFFRTTNNGTDWAAMDVPFTTENGTQVGLQPRAKAGSQGYIHFSMSADPNNSNLVYTGGDRQPDPNNGLDFVASNPNSIGAINYTGRLFSGNASASPGNQWTPITDNFARINQSAASGANGTGPHADSRAMAWLPNGSLIEADDAGLYMRSTPTLANGTWTSKNGDLSVTEVHRIAFDRNSGTLIGGTQDVGSIMQNAANGTAWTTFAQGDGGDVAVDNSTLAAQNLSLRYMQYTQFNSLSRTAFTATGVQSGNSTTLTLDVTSVVGGGTPYGPKLGNYTSTATAFYPRIQLNSVNANRIAFGGTFFLLESADKGDTLKQLNPTASPYTNYVTDIAYGGKRNGTSYEEILWAVSGNSVILRETTDVAPLVVASISLAANDSLIALALNPNDYYNIAVASSYSAWLTSDKAAFSNITGNLFTLGMKKISNLEFLSSPNGNAILAAGEGGLFASRLLSIGTWFNIGSFSGAIPNTTMADLLYLPDTDRLYASALGRGVWSLDNASTLIIPEPTTLPLLVLGGIVIGLVTKRYRNNFQKRKHP